MPWGFDLTPGVNVGAAFRQIWGGKDEDVIDGVSFAGGDRNPGDAPTIKVQDVDFSPYREARHNGGAATTSPTSGGGGAGSADARERANTLGLLDTELEAIAKSMGNLDTTWNAGKTQLQDAYNKGLSRLNEQQSSALTRYNTARGDAKQDFNRGAEDVDNQAYNNYSALMQMLGRSGAGSSSASQNVVPYAVSQNASKSRGNLSNQFGRNLRDIDEGEEETKRTYNNSVADLNDQDRASRASLESDILGKKSAYETQRAELQGKKAQANNGNWQNVKDSMSGTIAKRDEYDRALAGLLDRYRSPYDVKDVAVRDVKGGNYAVDSNGVKVDNPNGTGYDTDTSGKYLSNIKDEEERKKNKDGLVVA